jgi:aryl-alcohol dehydrogenase-like predicted oxidoreductase
VWRPASISTDHPKPRLGLGSAQWGMRYGVANRSGPPQREEIAKMLATARAAGIDFIDTARSYGDSERLIGELTGDDAHWTIATKLNADLGDDSNCQPDNLERLLQGADGSLATSHQHLGRKQIPILLLHRMQHRTACSGSIWDRLRRERSEGRIGKLGISTISPREAFVAIDDDEVEVVQVAANLADQRLVESSFFELARSRGVLVIVRSPFLQGALTLAIDQLPGHLVELGPLLQAIDDEAESTGTSRAELVFAHAGRLGDVVLVGCETEKQLRQNIAAWQRALTLPDPGPKFADLARRLPSDVIDPRTWPR